MDFVLCVCLLGAGIVALGWAFGFFQARRRLAVGVLVALWAGIACFLIASQFLWATRPLTGERAVMDRPIQAPTGDYVGSAECRSCHPHQHGTWHDSYHRTMTQAATEKSVLGNFNNVHLAGKDLKVRLFKEGGKFFAKMDFNNPEFSETYPVVMTTGSHTRQAYWMSSGVDERLMILPYMFLKKEQKWIPRHSGYINAMCLQDRPELAVFQGDFGRWSHVCITCHTTHGRPRPEDLAGPAGSLHAMAQAVEFGISCESCHGPGAKHVRINRNPVRRYEQRMAGGPDPTIVNPARLPHDRASDICGQCHSVSFHRSDEAQRQWVHHGYSFLPGEDLAKDPIRFIVRGRPELMGKDRPKDLPNPAESGSFWSDGMVRASGREYNGLLDSPCFQRGKMSCMSCHQMHQAADDPRARQDWADDQLKRGMEGNQACLQCHQKFLATSALTQHTHHPADSPGSQCYNCHMPYTTYGILKAIRSHQIDSPRVQASVDTGRPNACNQCHQDKTMAWTAERLERWYKIPAPKLGKEEQEIAATVLWALRGDAGQRAIMAWTYGWAEGHQAAGNHWQAPFLAQLLEDRYDAVRYIAQRSLRGLPGFQDLEYDFNGRPADRAAAHQKAFALWTKGQKDQHHPYPPQVLINPQGEIRRAEFLRLWQQRDDRPMAVNE